MKQEIYFNEIEAEWAYSLETHLQDAKEDGKYFIKLFPAIPDKDPDVMVCLYYQECGEKGNCGKDCDAYEPRNGKAGCCKHYRTTFYGPGDPVYFDVDTGKQVELCPQCGVPCKKTYEGSWCKMCHLEF